MIFMNEHGWNNWCRAVDKHLTNIEKTLLAYRKLQRRMLVVMGIGFIAVMINGLLLFYK